MTTLRCPSAELLRACAEGRSDDATATDVLRHAEGCASCGESLDRLLRAGLGIGTSPAPAPSPTPTPGGQ